MSTEDESDSTTPSISTRSLRESEAAEHNNIPPLTYKTATVLYTALALAIDLRNLEVTLNKPNNIIREH